MRIHTADSNLRPSPDQELVDIARYVAHDAIQSGDAYETARYCLMDTLACGYLALRFPACTSRTASGLAPGKAAKTPNGLNIKIKLTTNKLCQQPFREPSAWPYGAESNPLVTTLSARG